MHRAEGHMSENAIEMIRLPKVLFEVRSRARRHIINQFLSSQLLGLQVLVRTSGAADIGKEKVVLERETTEVRTVKGTK